MFIFVHYKLHLFESIQLYEENDVSHVSFWHTKVDLWPPKGKQNKNTLQASSVWGNPAGRRHRPDHRPAAVMCEAAQCSPTYSKKWERGNGMSTTSQISTSYSMKLIKYTRNLQLSRQNRLQCSLSVKFSASRNSSSCNYSQTSSTVCNFLSAASPRSCHGRFPFGLSATRALSSSLRSISADLFAGNALVCSNRTYGEFFNSSIHLSMQDCTVDIVKIMYVQY